MIGDAQLTGFSLVLFDVFLVCASLVFLALAAWFVSEMRPGR